MQTIHCTADERTAGGETGGETGGQASSRLPTLRYWDHEGLRLRDQLAFASGQRGPLGDPHHAVVRPLLSSRGRIVAITFIAVSIAFALLQHAQLSGELVRIFDSQQWLVMLGVWIVLKVIHELGHACTANYNGVRVGRAGVTFFMFAPLAYVDVTDAWKLPGRGSRVAIAMGGVYFELLCASIAVWVWWFGSGGLTAHFAAQIFFIAGPATLLVNANPLLRLDGYYVVSDWVDIPNLRDQGRRLLGGSIERGLFLMKRPKTHLAGWRRTFAACHAAASIVFQFVWMGGLVIVVSMWAGPVGLLIAAAALVLWTIVPAAKWFHRVWFYTDANEDFSVGSHRRRLMWTLLTIFVLLQFTITLPSPLVVSVPVVSRFSGDQILRSPAAGFVKQIYFQSGDFVRAGEIILEIDHEELLVRRDEIRLRLEIEAIEWQRNQRRSSLGLADASDRRTESLKRQLIEIQRQVDATKVKATMDGEILSPRLDQVLHQYVTPGVELVQIGNRDRKELLISVGEDELDTFNDAVTQGGTSRVCFRGGQWIDVPPHVILPRGSRTLPHPAMAATAGGPLAVTPSRKDEYGTGNAMELLSPRFEAIVVLPPSKSDVVRCGEIGVMGLQDKRSLARRFWQWLKQDSQP